MNTSARYKPKWFSEKELFCRCGCGLGGLHVIDERVLRIADAVREACGFPLHVNSAIRCRAHNKAVGGAPNSYHLRGQALDLTPAGGSETDFLARVKKLQELANEINSKGGVGFYPTFCHVDSGPKRRWGLLRR